MGEAVPRRTGVMPAPRAWLHVLESAWYVLLLAFALFVTPDPVPPGQWIEYGVVVAVALLCVVATLARWWWPDRLGAIAVGVLAVPVVVAALGALGPVGPVWPLRLTVSGAIQPVLLTVALRRCRLLVVVPVLVLAAAGLRLDIEGASFVRELLDRPTVGEPSLPALQIANLVMIIGPVAVGLLLRFTDAARRVERLARLRAEERLRTARELHDTVANHVTGMIVRAQATGLDTTLPDGARHGLEAIEETGNRALAAMRSMVDTLRSESSTEPAAPPAEGPGGSPVAVVRSALSGDADVWLRVDDGLLEADGSGRTAAGGLEVDPEVLDALHHVTVEGLTNARRHRPPGSGIEVELTAPDPEAIALQMTNDVMAAPAVSGGGWGLVGLRERAAAVGGRLTADPVDGGRWRLRLELPRRRSRTDRNG